MTEASELIVLFRCTALKGSRSPFSKSTWYGLQPKMHIPLLQNKCSSGTNNCRRALILLRCLRRRPCRSLQVVPKYPEAPGLVVIGNRSKIKFLLHRPPCVSGYGRTGLDVLIDKALLILLLPFQSLPELLVIKVKHYINFAEKAEYLSGLLTLQGPQLLPEGEGREKRNRTDWNKKLSFTYQT